MSSKIELGQVKNSLLYNFLVGWMLDITIDYSVVFVNLKLFWNGKLIHFNPWICQIMKIFEVSDIFQNFLLSLPCNIQRLLNQLRHSTFYLLGNCGLYPLADGAIYHFLDSLF